MKTMKKRILFFVSIIIASVGANAQNTSINYTTTRNGDMTYSTTGLIKTSMSSSNGYYLEIEVMASGQVISPTFTITSMRDKNFVKIVRSQKGEKTKVYATYTLSNGQKYTLDTYGKDNTDSSYMNSETICSFHFFSVFVQNNRLNPSTVSKFRKYDIESIQIGNDIIDLKKLFGFKTAPIIDKLCMELAKNGVNPQYMGQD
ncbi:MAG: hypothetical protein IKI07_07850 [Prevotella sp.]|nr:hypothetical protein [Prevotella sp.]